MSLETLYSLMDRMKELETMIEQHGMVLKANNVGLSEPVTDGESYPRSDIDVYAVRQARNSIIYLQNDRKKIMAEIEKGMALFFEQERNTFVQEQLPIEPMSVADCDEDVIKPTLEPFVVVEKVEPGQLADRMGITIKDKILQIGTLSSQNFKGLNQIQTMINNARGGKLQFVVRKASTGKDVTIEMDLSSAETRLGLFVKPLKE
ncbi:26S proteasome non-ATPase regulatory subunit 9 isoform X2 [Anopheles funestus]|uniref:26S proteasome non-ATPase regulatory subunit 9 n=1 Tax=Anopheles funestus TaxID=62324 RepID=UPI0020C6EBA1|nr:26S proteasome non-ATPase regulatory subunit 9 [Anopheles funestus]